MSFFDHFPKTKVDIVAPNGELRCSTQGILTEGEVQIADISIDVEPGDEVRRALPNGKEEVYIVQNATYNEGFHEIEAHYSVKLSRKGSFPKHTGGHYIHVAGNNARVNLQSTDNSVNIANSGSVIADLRAAITSGVSDEAERQALLDAAARLGLAADAQSKGRAYQALIANAANHMTTIAPFLPALAQFITGAPT